MTADHPSNDARQPGDALAVGRVIRPHGLRGRVLVQAYSEAIHSLAPGIEVSVAADPPQSAVVEWLRPHGGLYLLACRGFHDRESVEAWRGCDLTIPLAAAAPLPEGTYYYWQIIGLTAETEQGEALGQVTEVLETGANDVYVVRGEGRAEILLPAIPQVILHIDPQAGRMVVRLMEGLTGGAPGGRG